ncbi:MAG: hypothetical protein JJU18_13390 [Oceanicaulis sp.]|nr:hypothetical protein [Oceanicaulis sp.]
MMKSRREAIKLTLAAGLAGIVVTGAASGLQAFAEDPIPGVDVVVEKIPPGHAVGRTVTDQRGMIMFRDLEAGYYEVRNADNSQRAGVRHPGGPARWQLRLRSDPASRRQIWVLSAVSTEAPARR